MIRNLFYFNKIFQLFGNYSTVLLCDIYFDLSLCLTEDMANSPSERRIDLANFKAHAKTMGIAHTDAEAEVCIDLNILPFFNFFSASLSWYLRSFLIGGFQGNRQKWWRRDSVR